MRTSWVTVEGLNGVGKTYLARQVAERLRPGCLLVDELTDTDVNQLPGQVVRALTRSGATFLRTGHPLTETLALLALKAYEYEHAHAAASLPALVLEDRGVDTVAVYQAVILTDREGFDEGDAVGVMRRVYDTAAMWWPLPDRTLLIIDDFNACVDRFAEREGALLPADRHMLRRVAALYRRQAEAEPERFLIIDRRGRTETDVVDEMAECCLALSRADDEEGARP